MKILAVAVMVLWVVGVMLYQSAMRGPRDDFGSGAFVLTIALGIWALVHWWPA